MPLISGKIKYFILSVVTLSLFLAPAVISATAVTIPTFYSESQNLDRDPNGNFYATVPVDSDKDAMFEFYANPSNDLNYRELHYYLDGWTSVYSSMIGSARQSFDFYTFYHDNNDPFGNPVRIPEFIQFINQTNDLDIELEWTYSTFPLSMEHNTTVVLDPVRLQIGILNVTEPFELQYWIVQNHQDVGDLYCALTSPDGVWISDFLVNAGDSTIIPVPFKGLGVYHLYTWPDTIDSTLFVSTISIVNIEPIPLEGDQLVQGTLQGSEWVIRNDNIVYDERVPTAYTYKISSPPGQPGRLSFSFNYPEFTDTYTFRQPLVFITSTINAGTTAPASYSKLITSSGYVHWYQSFENETYYVTIIGQDNVEFNLFNEYPEVEPLPVNTNVYLESPFGDSQIFAYTLHLSEDSFVMINSTEYTPGFTWNFYTLYNGIYRSLYVSDSSSFKTGTPRFLKAGDYLVTATPSDIDRRGMYSIHLTPVVDGAGLYEVDDFGLLAVRLPTPYNGLSAVNISLMTENNVSVTIEADIYSPLGRNIADVSATLGHVDSGFGWTAVGNNFTSYLIGPGGYDAPSDSSLLCLRAYDTKNTTSGSPADLLPGVVHSFNIEVVDYLSDFYNGTGSLNPTSGSTFKSFVFDESQESTEFYLLDLITTPNIWYNISVATEDITNVIIKGYTIYKNHLMIIPSTSFDYTKVGTATDFDIFYGAPTSRILLVLTVARDPVVQTGYLNITVTPLVTNILSLPTEYNVADYISTPTGTSGGLDLLSNGLVIAGVAGAAGIVVAIVVLKKKGKI